MTESLAHDPLPADPAFDAAVARHDSLIEALGLQIWVGSEPTFTDRLAQTAEWLGAAVGGDKEARARRLLHALWQAAGNGVVLRSVGRRYPGESLPHWNLGLYRRRDGAPVWDGPPDPIVAGDAAAALAPDSLDAWAAALGQQFAARGWPVAQVAAGAAERRLVMRTDAACAIADVALNPQTLRPPVDAPGLHPGGLRDELAESGSYLFVLRAPPADGRPAPRIDLPLVADVALFGTLLQAVGQAANAAALPSLILAGYPPPVDAGVELTTVTPDPAVIEINAAPSAGAAEFLARSRLIYAAAAAHQLAPYRLYFNGVVADSGGAGQITLGGPAPALSPFIVEPRLLPRLVRFANRHPALSYLFCHDFAGASGQSVRADERGCDAFDELALALALIGRQPALSAETLWHSLASFLCDASGNSHRAELNIEKLCNPFLPGRGRLGLVEFRALRMQHTPERAAALACLLRAIVAMLARQPYDEPLIDWGRDLHERFALPFYLEQDLATILAALAAAGLGLGRAIEQRLEHDECRGWGRIELPGAALEVRRALEFWPLLGDTASPEQGGSSRMIDAGTARIELRLRPAGPADAGWRDWQVIADGIPLPLRSETDAGGECRVYGLRYRSFVPTWSLHPTLGTQMPLQLLLRRADSADERVLTLHEWRPDGAAYDGLPHDLADAGSRRAQRIVVERRARAPDPGTCRLQGDAQAGLGRYCLDLRYRAA